LAIFTSCEISGENENYENLKIVNDGEHVLGLSVIEYYDFATHIFYLTENNRLEGNFDKLQGAGILVDGSEIYPFKIYESYSSSSPVSSHFNRNIDNFGDFAFRIKSIPNSLKAFNYQKNTFSLFYINFYKFKIDIKKYKI
jgi:hypothetical protein